MSEANWPAGDFFYGGFCPRARSLNFTNCAEFYRENSATIEISYAQLGYKLLKESPHITASDVIKSMAGNTGLWIGFTAVSVGELLLMCIQLLLWICTKNKELPEVPSCRRRNYHFKGREDIDGDDDDYDKPAKRNKQELSDAGCVPVAQSSAADAAALSSAVFSGQEETVPRHRLSPKSFDNARSRVDSLTSKTVLERAISPSGVRADVPQKDSLYERIELVMGAEYSASLAPPALASALDMEKPAFE